MFDTIFKIQTFSSKIEQNMLLGSTFIKFAESGDTETADRVFLNSNGELVETRRAINDFWNQNFAVFSNSTR